jgi:SAM-dependent methyltransferase
MRNSWDAFGHALWDYLHGNWPSRHRQALRYAKGRVLDVGCGAGRHALYLQRKGLDVVGIDTSPLALAVCRRRGLKNVRLVSINQIRSAPGTFSTVLMLGNNFGLFANPERARRLLGRLHRITGQDARILAESLDPYQTDNPFHLAYQRRNKQRGRMAGQIRIRVRYQKYVTSWFDYLFVSREEMRKTLGGTGWAVKRFIPPRGPSYIAVIVKAGEPRGPTAWSRRQGSR